MDSTNINESLLCASRGGNGSPPSVLAWKTPRPEEPAGPQSTGAQRDTTERLSSSEPDQHGGAAGADSRPRGRLESGDTRGSWPAGAVAGPGWRGSEVGEQFKEGGCKPRPLDATQGPRGR